MSFRIRSLEKEFLDRKEIDITDLYRNLHELNIINRLLGGYKISVKGLQRIIQTGYPVQTVADIGCGGGDTIRHFAIKYFRSKNKIFYHGVDFKQSCIVYAEKNLAVFPNKRLHCIDYRFIPPEFFDRVDVIHCSLFLHHLDEEEIVKLFRKAFLHRCAIIVNDLHRNWLAYHAIRLLTTLFSKSWLVKNDAPVSVKRGFSRKELSDLISKAGYTYYEIKWCWAFRYLLVAIP